MMGVNVPASVNYATREYLRYSGESVQIHQKRKFSSFSNAKSSNCKLHGCSNGATTHDQRLVERR